jgi:excisionase family DNA binding protein
VPQPSFTPILLTARQVAVLLQIPVSSVYEYARRPHNPLPSISIGRHRRFRRDEIDRWLDDQRGAAA